MKNRPSGRIEYRVLSVFGPVANPFKIQLILLVLITLLRCRSGDLEPLTTGSLRINLDDEISRTSLSAQVMAQTDSDRLAQVRCIVQKGTNTVFDDTLQKIASGFERTITDLIPGEDYAVLVYGKNSDSDIIARSYETDIAVQAGEITTATISWDSFTPLLEVPVNGSSMKDGTPIFIWDDVISASAYALEVDDSDRFDTPVINQIGLSIPSYTTPESLPDGVYFWHVRVRDAQGYWGGWSTSWRFTIDTQNPDAPALVFPPNETTMSDNTPAFTWSVIDDAACYQIIVAEDSGFMNPVISDSCVADPAYTPSQSIPDHTYFWKVRAIDSAGNRSAWSEAGSFTIVEPETIIDVDGNVYPVVRIGDQLWMADHLRVTHYRNGDALSHLSDNMEWASTTSGAYCAFENDEGDVPIYGYLYNWYAVHGSRQIAPDGWHVPTDEEWKALEMFLGMDETEANETGYRGTDEGGKLKSTGTEYWYSPNAGATDAFGFSAHPGGYRYGNDGVFYSSHHYATFWTATAYYDRYAWYRYLTYDTSKIIRGYNDKPYGYSVRCIRD